MPRKKEALQMEKITCSFWTPYCTAIKETPTLNKKVNKSLSIRKMLQSTSNQKIIKGAELSGNEKETSQHEIFCTVSPELTN